MLQTKKLSIPDEQGNPRFLLGISEDVTERKQAEQQIRDSEAKYRGLIEQASDGIFVSDAEGNLLLANSRWCELLGYTKDGVTGMNARETYLEEEKETHAKRLEQVRAGQTLRFERVVRRKDGSNFPAEISLKMLDNGLIQGIFHDIATRRAQEHKIARLSRIQAVLSGINSAIVRIRDRQTLFDEVCRLSIEHGGFTLAWIRMTTPDAQGGRPIAWRCANDSFLDLIPLSVETDAGRAHAERVMSAKRAVVYNDLTQADDFPFAGQALQAGALSLAKLPLVVSGEAVGIFALYANEAGVFDDEEMKLLNELVGDVSFGLEFIAKEEEVNYLAYYDVLTKLPNRTLLHDRLGQYLHAAQRGRRMAAVMLIDLERFHVVNDTLGRNAADEVLREIASRLQLQIRTEDTVARVGADCFAIALSDAGSTAEVAHAVHERVFAFLKQPPVRIGDQDLRPSAKFGVAVFPSDGSTAEALYSNAEAALKKAKASGERFLFYAPEMNARVAESLTLENKLRSALDRDQFVLHYQPKVSLRGREVVGLEALIRWKDPELGLVPPAKFIPLMEETGLILDVGRWALSQVARDCKLWAKDGFKPPRVAVNVSPLQLRQKNFVDIVIEAAEMTRKAGSMLDLEITESVIMENVEAIIQKLQTIRELGVEIAVDDFGTGYSSLAYIARLPIHDLKIDRSFVVGMTESKDSLAIVKSVISLAHSLRLKVVAEGVETEEQAALLLKLGCDEMQGYLFSPPVPPAKVPELLSGKQGAVIRSDRRHSRRSPAR
jgi:diguanylate cyclase (GGDEF)-like protein/PAS domain S-box-containing protein